RSLRGRHGWIEASPDGLAAVTRHSARRAVLACLLGAFCPDRIPSRPFLSWQVIDPVASRRNGALASFLPWPSAIPRGTRSRPLAVLHCVSALRVRRPAEAVSHCGHGKARDGRGLPNQNRRHIP